jgi:anaerobic ribonucleoside-triphosphate reductase activating protein
MRYADIKKCDVANGPGVRISLFVSGCRHACKGCFNKEAWDFEYGKEFTEGTIKEIIKLCSSSYINGLTILGGEPFEPANQEGIYPLVKAFREAFGTSKDLWIYTGFDFERDLMGWMDRYLPYTREIVEACDVVVDGPFIQDLYKPALRFKGSSNQRLIEIDKYFESGEIVTWDADHPIIDTVKRQILAEGRQEMA